MEKKNYKNLLGLIVIIFPFVHWIYILSVWKTGGASSELYQVDYIMKTISVIAGIYILTSPSKKSSE